MSIGIVVALAATGLFLTATTIGLLSVSQVVPFDGTITTLNVGVFIDQQCTQNATSMSWGGVYAGESQTMTIYVKNTGDSPLTLSMNILDWEPSYASSVLSMTWNRENTVIDSGQVTQATLTLSVSSNPGALSSFNYNMLITGTSQE